MFSTILHTNVVPFKLQVPWCIGFIYHNDQDMTLVLVITIIVGTILPQMRDQTPIN